MDSYLDTLQRLSETGFRFLVIGTWGLQHLYPQRMCGYQVADCDLLLPDDLEEVRKIVRRLHSQRWRVSVWKASCVGTEPDTFYQHKFYARATLKQLTLDLTYESPILFSTAWKNRVTDSGVTFAHLYDSLYLKSLKGRAKDFEVINRFIDVLPNTSFPSPENQEIGHP